STTAPSAPSARSFHMNQNRCWPGVPNRYSTRSSAMVMRPKSRATVVDRFCSMPSRSSTSRPAVVSGSSVRSGTISLTEPTMVVLPTPKPPAIRILTVSGASEPAKAIPHFLKQVQVRGRAGHRARRTDGDPARLQQVAEQDDDDAHREVQARGEFRHRDRL